MQVHVISCHPLVALAISDIISRDPALRMCFSSESCPNPKNPRRNGEPCLFLLDSCSLPMEFAAVRRLLCLRCPESKFMALLSPEKATDDEMIRLVYEGIDGCLALTELYGQEFPKALQSIISGNLWIPHHILREYIRQTNFLLNAQLRPDPRLTARENQAFRLMIRRLSNKEIAAVLGISERTAKFHISNIFSKLKLHDRHELLASVNLIEVPQPCSVK